LLGLKTVTFASRIKSLGIVHPTRSINDDFRSHPNLPLCPPSGLTDSCDFPDSEADGNKAPGVAGSKLPGGELPLSVALIADGGFRPVAVLPPVFASCSLAVGFLPVAETAVTTGVTRAQLVSATPNCHGTFPGTLRDV
jgi:hypothetical protein